MIISQHCGFAFIHNPKVAGTSIRKTIEQYHDWPRRFWHQGWSTTAHRVVDAAHIPMADHDPKVKDALRHLFVFGFVRNPYRRFWASLAEFRRQHADWAVSKLSANELLTGGWLTEANVLHDWRFTHFCPQHAFFYDGSKCVADFIGHHETFERDWEVAKLMLNVDVQPLANARHRGTSDEEPLSIDAATQFVQLYGMDYMLFGYNLIELEGLSLTDSPPRVPTHFERVEAIHNPRREPSTTMVENMPVGERVALLETEVAHYRKMLNLREREQSQ